MKQPPEQSLIEAADAVDAALETYRRLLHRYQGTLDLMSERGLADLDTKLAEAERYAAAVGALAPSPGLVLDLGSGAGLPGVVVAARLRDHQHVWVERRRKRATFLNQVAAQAGLAARVRVLAEDVRDLDAASLAPVVAITAQAVATLPQVAQLTEHLWAEPGVLLVSRKGPAWPEEVEALAAAYKDWAKVDVLRAEPLGARGTLVAVRMTPFALD